MILHYIDGLEQGREQGIELGYVKATKEGIERLLLKKEYSPESIADIFNVPPHLVIEIKDRLIKEGQL